MKILSRILNSLKVRLRPFQGGFVFLKNGEIYYISFGSYQSRWGNTISLLKKSCIRGTHLFFISTEDLPYYSETLLGLKVLSYSGKNGGKNIIPCHAFEKWHEAGIGEFNDFLETLKSQPENAEANIGWRGAATNPVRNEIVLKYNQLGDFKLIDWDRRDESGVPVNFMTMEEQARAWRYQLDLPGVGYSGRLKYWLAAEKIVFIKPFKYNEWWFEHLEEWKHFIPIENFDDIQVGIEFLKDNPEKTEEMKNALKTFTKKYLTLDAQEKRWAEVLTK